MSAAFPDATYQTYTYLTNNKVLAHNERDLNSTLSYRSFGTPAKQELIRIDSPENILTEIQRNILGLTTRVWQGDAVGGVGYEKTYGYDSRYFLTSMTQPEIGTTLFGRDEVGNLTGKQIGTTLLANYQYDYQNRQTYQDYFDASFNNVNISYDGNGNVKTLTRGSGNAALSKSFTYDDNDNLQREDIQYGLQSFAILYDHTNLDHVNTISYPSGRVVTYAPNALGRPRSVPM